MVAILVGHGDAHEVLSDLRLLAAEIERPTRALASARPLRHVEEAGVRIWLSLCVASVAGEGRHVPAGEILSAQQFEGRIRNRQASCRGQRRIGALIADAVITGNIDRERR